MFLFIGVENMKHANSARADTIRVLSSQNREVFKTIEDEIESASLRGKFITHLDMPRGNCPSLDYVISELKDNGYAVNCNFNQKDACYSLCISWEYQK